METRAARSIADLPEQFNAAENPLAMNVNGIWLEVAEFGDDDRTPVVLLHEGLGSVGLWRNFPERLAAVTGRRIIAWSRRGYGQSDPHAAPYGVDFMHQEADAAVHLFEALGLERAHLFGHSDGASIALLMAARHSRHVASLFLEAPHIFVEGMCIEQIRAFGMAIGASDTIERLGKYHRDPEAVFRHWHGIWVDPDFRSWSIEKEIGGIVVPTLLVQGENDEYGTFEQIDRIVAILPHAMQLRLADCAHSPHRDQLDAVLRAAHGFFKELD